MGRIVIAAFKPEPDCDTRLREVVAKHWGILRAEGLVTDRQRMIMQASDGTLIEIFEWCSAEAIEQAHRSAAVQALWAEFEAVCDYVPLAGLCEAQNPFAEFDAMGL